MFKQKKYIIIIIGLIFLVCAVLTIYFIQQSNPKNVIEKKLKINTSSCLVLNYNYDKYEGCFNAKLLIPENSMDVLKEQLNTFFDGSSKLELAKTPNFINSCPWWDLDKNKVHSYYFRFMSEKNFFGKSSHEVWAFVTTEKSGQYYLYISY